MHELEREVYLTDLLQLTHTFQGEELEDIAKDGSRLGGWKVSYGKSTTEGLTRLWG